MKKKFTAKKALKLGIFVFSLLYGVKTLLVDFGEYFRVFEVLLWLLFFGFCTYLVMRTRNIDFSSKLVIRFFVAAVIGLIIIWLEPWAGVTQLGTYANGISGVLASAFIVFFIAASVPSLIIYGVVAFSVRELSKINVVVVVRFILVASLSAIVMSIFSIIFLLLYQSAPLSILVVFPFFDGMLSQLFFGITYYYVVSLFLNETPSGEKEIEAQK